MSSIFRTIKSTIKGTINDPFGKKAKEAAAAKAKADAEAAKAIEDENAAKAAKADKYTKI